MAPVSVAARGKPILCVVYIRTSSAANVGEDKNSEPRQQAVCKAYATRKGWKIMREFRDPAVSGTDPLICRTGFVECINYCLSHAVQFILVESGDRFARNLVVQETGLTWLAEVSLQLISVENDTQSTTPL
jgi:DNA invertase Pin-like site-specific DNA recombinase